MKKIISTAILMALLLLLSACNTYSTINDSDYNNVVSERDELLLLNEELENKIESVTAIQMETTVESTSETTAEKQSSPPANTETLESSTETENMAGQVETERKYLLDVNNLPNKSMKIATIYNFTQTYINYSPEIRVRARTGNKNDYYMTIKVPVDDTGLSRQEIEFFISADEYAELIKKQIGTVILKTRYQFWEENYYISVDVYSGDLSGLAVAEIEFDSVKEANSYTPPEWFGEDITSDSRYKNANLSKNGMPK